jgi:hypothetical protein
MASGLIEESQFQTQLSGPLDTIPEFFPVSGRALQPLEPHLLCRLLPSKTPYSRGLDGANCALRKLRFCRPLPLFSEYIERSAK